MSLFASIFLWSRHATRHKLYSCEGVGPCNSPCRIQNHACGQFPEEQTPPTHQNFTRLNTLHEVMTELNTKYSSTQDKKKAIHQLRKCVTLHVNNHKNKLLKDCKLNTSSIEYINGQAETNYKQWNRRDHISSTASPPNYTIFFSINVSGTRCNDWLSRN